MFRTCSSCRREVEKDFVQFKCPSCGKTEVVRCAKCRQTAAEYTCKECGFTGP